MRQILAILILILAGCGKEIETIKIKGSDTEVNLAVLLCEKFHHVNESVLVSVSGGGSGLGIASLLNGNADIANSSRSIKSAEIAMFRDKHIEIDSFVFAQDAIAFIVSDKMPFDSIDVQHIKKILSGSIDDWSSFTNDKMPITIYGRQSNSGTYEFIKKILTLHYAPSAKQMNGNAQILESIKVDESGIGYVSAGYVLKGKTEGIKVLKIYSADAKAISPLDSEAIASGRYFFQRPLFQYYRKNNYRKIKPFLDFEKSREGADIIQQSGYYPVNK